MSTGKLYFRPRLDSVTPNFGPTSGSQTVTVKGQGFADYTSVKCFFGNYNNLDTAAVIEDDLNVRCLTPAIRGEFNTDVGVILEFDGNIDQRIEASFTFHYGPQCYALNPNLLSTVRTLLLNVIMFFVRY